MKKFVLMIVALAMIFITTSCTKKDNATSNDARGNSPTEIELYYYKQENQEGLRKLCDKFQKANPNIKIKLLIIPNDGDATISARAMQGKLPAIMQMQSYSKVTEFASKGYLADLTDIDALRRVIPTSIPSVTFNNRQYGVPMDFAGCGIIYNKTLFGKLGIKPPRTWNELTEVCNTLRQNNIAPFAGLLKENWAASQTLEIIHTMLLAANENDLSGEALYKFYRAFIDKMNSGNSSYVDGLDKDRLFEVLRFFRENISPDAAEMDGAAQQRAFANGEAAMVEQGLWTYVDAKKLNPILDAGFVPFPIFDEPERNKFYADVDSTFVVSNQVTPIEKDAAITFLNWLSSDEGKESWVSDYKLTHSFIDGNFESLGAPFNDLITSVAEIGSYPWVPNFYPSVVAEDACKNATQKYLLNLIDEDAVIDAIDKQWKEAVKNNQ